MNDKNTKINKQKTKAKLSLKKRVKGKPTKNNRNTLFSSLAFIVTRALKILVIFSLIVGFLLAGVGGGMLAGYVSTAQPVDSSTLQNFNKTTVLLDMNGNELIELTGSSGSKSEYVPYVDFENTYIDEAFIAIEDERFIDHPGIDSKRIASSIFSALVNLGTPTHGGSTITQQTVKMISGADSISAQRKIQEWYAAIELEKSLSKEGIMELYLNLVPMSNNITGIGAAALYYFNKDASELTLLECAFLAGIPNQPAVYNPMTEYGRRNSLRRMRMTLAKMLDLNSITQEEYNEALNAELNFDFSYFEKKDDNIYSWFEEYAISEVISDLITKNGYSPEMASLTVFNQGLTIETTVDPIVQNKLEEAYLSHELHSKDQSQVADSPETPQSSISVLENNPLDPGRIRGIVGGFGEKKENFIFNRAVDAKRQPASAIKPLVVYGPALDAELISDATILIDEATQLDPFDPSRDYPLNYYRSYYGEITLEEAIVNSTNTIAADLFMNTVTPELGLSYLKKLGIDRMDEQFPSTALGGLAQGVSSLEMAGAFSSFANQGIYVKPTSYFRVLKHDGTVLLDNTAPAQVPVFKPATTTVITKNLEKVASNVKAKPDNAHAAGKTGTSEDMIDMWFCGYTPYYSAAVWYGYDNTNGRKIEIPQVDILTAADIWNFCMTSLHEDLEDRQFPINDGVTSTSVCAQTGLLATSSCPNTFMALLIDGSAANPINNCVFHTQTTPEPEKTTTQETSSEDSNSNQNDTSESAPIATSSEPPPDSEEPSQTNPPTTEPDATDPPEE